MKIRLAQPQDFPQVIAIYNQAIPCRRITADLEPVTESQRQAWFNEHLHSERYPIWVLENESAVKNSIENDRTSPSLILGWCSFSPFYDRAAFAETVEVSLYLDHQAKGKGYGSKALAFMQSQMASYGAKTLMAYVIEENQISRKVFEKQGFEQWGRFPNIANMGDSLQTFLMYGFQILE